jgi:microcompartment protein CcmL/EutN
MPDAVGMIELSSIALGYEVEDAMLKAADVQLLLARTVCSGKYLIIVGGTVSGVQTSVETGRQVAPDGVIDSIVIPNVHASIFPAISGAVDLGPSEVGALGIVETFSAASAVEAADAAVKAGSVVPFRIHLAMAIGGKGYALVTGDVSACRAAIAAASDVAAEHGLLVNRVVIPRPRAELFREFI